MVVALKLQQKDDISYDLLQKQENNWSTGDDIALVPLTRPMGAITDATATGYVG